MMSELHKEHRKRMDKKVEIMGLHSLEKHEALEVILYAVIPRENTNEIAKKLIDKFGSVGNVLKADVDELTEIEGVGSRTAKFLNNLYDVLGIVERTLEFPKEKIKTREDAINYAKTFFYGKLTEQFYMISLNKSGGVINHRRIGDGVTDEVHIYPRNIAVKALQDEASSVIIAHNHPSGNLSASFADEQMTDKVEKALNAVGIKLFDSVIVSGGKGISICREEY